MASVTVVFGGVAQKTFALDKARMVVGREPKCDIHIDNLGISREHCAFSQNGQAYLVQDLNSSNGTYVNGRKVTEHFLNNDDEIIIGKYMLKFKNEAQVQQPEPVAAAESAPVPDTLNTYVMDGPKIQQQLAKMRADKTPGAVPAAVADSAPVKPAVTATARDYGKAMDPNLVPVKAGGGGKFVVIFLVLAFLFLLFVLGVVALYVLYLKSRGILCLEPDVVALYVQQYFIAR